MGPLGHMRVALGIPPERVMCKLRRLEITEEATGKGKGCEVSHHKLCTQQPYQREPLLANLPPLPLCGATPGAELGGKAEIPDLGDDGRAGGKDCESRGWFLGDRVN